MCRLREERAAERRKQEADAAWRQLLRSIWTRLRLNQDYGDNAAARAGQDHAHIQVTAPREELSGDMQYILLRSSDLVWLIVLHCLRGIVR